MVRARDPHPRPKPKRSGKRISQESVVRACRRRPSTGARRARYLGGVNSGPPRGSLRGGAFISCTVAVG